MRDVKNARNSAPDEKPSRKKIQICCGQISHVSRATLFASGLQIKPVEI